LAISVRRLVAILNPRADRGRTALLAASLREQLGDRFELTLLETQGRGDGKVQAAKCARDQCEAVLAIGGDGTVHEVANGLLTINAGRRPVMGILPAGSGNDVAFALGISKQLEPLIDSLATSSTRCIDVGLVRASDGRTCFLLNNMGLLLEGDINLASHRYHWPRGSGLYVRAMLAAMMRRLPAARLTLTIDGKTLDRTAMILSIANGPRSGGKFFLATDAAIDDGRMNYVLARPAGRLRVLRMAVDALRGSPPQARWIERGEFQRMSIESDVPVAAHVDGEPWLRPEDDIRQVSLELMPRALSVLCPSA
jgi:YegS/Rv2252/BmrU family lipid kinase